MFETLKRLYQEGKATGIHIMNAFEKGWITEEEYNTIVGD